MRESAMNKKVRKQISKEFARNSAKSDLSDPKFSENEGYSDRNIVVPVLKLPSVDLCVSNTYPISCIKPKFTEELVREGGNRVHADLHHSNVSYRSEEDTCGSESNDEAIKNKLDLLNGQLYLMDLLHRIIKLGFYNKREILSLYNCSIKKNSMFNLNFVDNNIVKTLIKSRLSRLSNYKFTTNKFLSEDDLDDLSFEADDIVCFDNSTFSLLDTFLIHTGGPVSKKLSQPGYNKTLDEDQMLSNLLSGKLCNGKEPTSFDRFILSILLINKYDYLSPNLINLVLSSSKVNDCDF